MNVWIHFSLVLKVFLQLTILKAQELKFFMARVALGASYHHIVIILSHVYFVLHMLARGLPNSQAYWNTVLMPFGSFFLVHHPFCCFTWHALSTSSIRVSSRHQAISTRRSRWWYYLWVMWHLLWYVVPLINQITALANSAIPHRLGNIVHVL
jgi:hypothetical protein